MLWSSLETPLQRITLLLLGMSSKFQRTDLQIDFWSKPHPCWEVPFFDLFIREGSSGLSPSSCLEGGDLALANRVDPAGG